MLPNRLCSGTSRGKLRLLVPGSPPVWMPKESAPKGSKVSELDQKKRSDKWSLPPRNSRSQFAVNWLSVNLPGSVTTKGSYVRQGVVEGTLVGSGYKYPPAPAPNWLLLKFSRLNATGSMLGTPQSASIAAVDWRSTRET